MEEQTLEERVAALETALTSLTSEGEYSLRFSGERIDEILENASKIHSGTAIITLSAAAAYAVATLNFSGFMPTKVVASVRTTAAGGSPFYNYCVLVMFSQGRWQVCLTNGANNGSTTVKLPAGTYYIDWIGVEA